ncbi:MAG: aldo/keto reductase [Crenarchaeota archaeon]|nr:aldo/keto reductase [Thermoproteota archaeon]MDA1124286.1 aldo/keto reductase [Thermoproteota archaeon]
MISGFATSTGTKTFSEKFLTENYNSFQDLYLSNIGLGTYLGEPDSQTDMVVKDAVKKSILSGVNVIDTAINYRAQKSERSIGIALSELINENSIKREQVFVCTKNGYVTNDGDIKEDFMQYVMRELGQPGIVKEGDISSGYHCMTVPYLQDQLERSLKNLNLECIDLMYLHNAVEGHPEMSQSQFLENLKKVFEFYEEKRKEGKIRFYGLATWECFRVISANSMFLSLEDVVKLAQDVGGSDHGFRFIQLPFNLHFDQAMLLKNQLVAGMQKSILDSAHELGIGVFTSVPLMQGKLLEWAKSKPLFATSSASVGLLQFIRSTPGVLAPLIGQKSRIHVDENLEIMKINSLNQSDYDEFVKKLVS